MTGDRGDSREETQRIRLLDSVLDAHSSMAIAAAEGGEPWIARVFFVDDEPAPGRLDLCCALIAGSRTLAMIQRNARVAFLVAGEIPDRWLQGVGSAEVLADDADCEAIAKRLGEKASEADAFLGRVTWRGLRIHVDRLKLTDLAATPPVAELSFA
ncbi:MAG: pyridoxamine 5'-phosphate oxidase family protein [Acidobacteria bacterium]|nr:pyridoxamine 5'-phosphate oxidase family protein [Acidobacteriota bacterium]